MIKTNTQIQIFANAQVLKTVGSVCEATGKGFNQSIKAILALPPEALVRLIEEQEKKD